MPRHEAHYEPMDEPRKEKSGTGILPVGSDAHGQDAHATFQPGLLDLAGFGR